MFQCTRCEKMFKEYDQLRRHTGKVHKIHTSQLYVETYLNGEWPLCKCGCGERVKWRSEQPTHFMTYVIGHNARGDSNPIHTLTEDEWKLRKARHSATNKAQFASGERKMWSEGKSIETDPILQKAAKKISENKERGRKISKALKGKPKTTEHMKKIHTAQREWLKSSQLRKETKPERGMANILTELEILFEKQVSICHFLFDFQILNSKILIEVDGDFFHCHPEKFPNPIFETQKVTLRNDKKKFAAIQKEGYTLLRFWESDINNTPELVKSQLMNYIS